MKRYSRSAAWYDAISGESIYRVGRECGISALHLREGSRVLDVGCGTGLSFPYLLDVIGPRGEVVGVDRSHEMLEVARRKTAHLRPGNVSLVEADAERLDRAGGGFQDAHAPFDALIFTYSLSLMTNREAAWRQAISVVRPGGRVAIVDMEPPHGWARFLDPAARLACWLGGADITARPWTLLERTVHDVQSWSFRGGHVQVRVGTLESE